MTDENQPPAGASVPPQQPVPPAPPAPPAAPDYSAPVPPAAPQYAAPVPPAYQPAPAGGSYPGRALGITGLIVAIVGFFIIPFVSGIVALILSIIGRNQSKAAGLPNPPAKAGIIVSIIVLALSIIIGIIVTIAVVAAVGTIVANCNDLGPGTHIVNGVTYTCS
jgi:hypothetical protein